MRKRGDLCIITYPDVTDVSTDSIVEPPANGLPETCWEFKWVGTIVCIKMRGKLCEVVHSDSTKSCPGICVVFVFDLAVHLRIHEFCLDLVG